MTDEQLAEALARKLAEKNGFPPDQLLARADQKFRHGQRDFVKAADTLPAWQAFRDDAAAMIEAVRSFGPEEQAAFSRLFL